MSKRNNVYYESNAQWKQAIDVYAASGGTWKKARAKLVGAKGKWTEVYDNEPDPGSVYSINVNELSYRSGTPWQGELQLIGHGLSGIPAPQPTDFYYFPMRRNRTEYSENGAGPVGISSDSYPIVPVTEDGGAYQLNPELNQYFRLPTDTFSGVDLKGIVGTLTGDKMWLTGIQFKPLSMPESGLKFVLYAGQPGQRIYIGYNAGGDVVFTWEGSDHLTLTLPNECEVGRWTGVWVMHIPGDAPKVILKSNRGNVVESTGSIPYFIPTMAEEDAAFMLGMGLDSGSIVDDTEYLAADNTHPSMVLLSPLEFNYTGTAYVAAQPGDIIHPGTGSYYLEISNRTSYDMQLGVAEPTESLAVPPGVVGWCVNTISGRRFNHQTGGGTNWSTATPPNSRIGLLYDSDAGQIEYFVNGVSRGRPFPANSIKVPVKFIIGGRAQTTTTNPLNPLIAIEPNDWQYTAAGSLHFPYKQKVSEPAPTYYDGFLRGFFIRNAPYTSDHVQDALIDPHPMIDVIWKARSNGSEFNANHLIIKQVEDRIIITVPDLTPGEYDVFIRTVGYETGHKTFTIVPFAFTMDPLHIDFATSTKQEIRRHLMRAHKGWGGINGGCVAENIIHDEENGLLKIRACGDWYTGPIKGVDRMGELNGFNKRIGGCIVTRDYFGPGSYRVNAKLPYEDGVVSAFWTFHYEEGYPGHPLYDEHLNDGIRRAGNAERGYYTVRNHEIDIEIPTALKTDPDMQVVQYKHARFNTWRGENRNWDVAETDPQYWSEYTDDFINHGVETNDGQFHEFRFDWHLEGTPRVEFYIDGVLKHTVYDTIPDIPGRFWVGLWFPSSPNNHWAGRTADFDLEWMDIKEIHIIPFSDVGVRPISESYPNDVYRDMYDE